MDLRRVRVWDWLTGLAGLVLLVSLFIPWYGASRGGATATGWESFAVVDVILAIAAAVAIALPIATATQRTPAVPQGWSSLTVWPALVATILAVIRLIDPPGAGGVSREAGVWIATASAVAMLVLAWRSMSDDSFPRTMRPRLDVTVIPSPGADGRRRDIAS